MTLTVLLIFAAAGAGLQAQNNGENLFKTTCAACHTINKGRLIGPDLTRVYEKRDTDWLIRYIRSSQQLVKEGDSVAVALFQEFNQIPMPDNNWSDDQILSVLDYIKEIDGGETVVATKGEPSVVSAKQMPDTAGQAAVITYSDEMLKKGEALFYGYERFTHGASACIACHRIQDEFFVDGGKLSTDLSKSYSRLGSAGINAILSNPPFPVMNMALRNKKLSEDEIQSISAMLHSVDASYGESPSRSTADLTFVVIGFVIAMNLLVIFYILYDNRKIPS